MLRFVIALAIVLALSANAAAAATTVTVQSSVSVRPLQMVKLGEIATVTGAKADVERLNQVEIARSAIPGSARQVTAEWIRTRLACSGFDAKSIILKSPSTVILVSQSQSVKGSDIAEAAKQYITSQLSQSDISYTLSETGTQMDIVVPTGRLELVAEHTGRTISPGRQQVYVDVLVDGVLYTKKTVGLNLRASGPVLVATQSIRAREPLTASNTRIEQRDIPSSAAGYVSVMPDDGVKVASKSISAGTAITGDMLAARTAISKGDPVVVLVRSSGVKVVVKGIASQDGFVGDSIKISVPTTREDIQATIVQPGLVEVRI